MTICVAFELFSILLLHSWLLKWYVFHNNQTHKIKLVTTIADCYILCNICLVKVIICKNSMYTTKTVIYLSAWNFIALELLKGL